METDHSVAEQQGTGDKMEEDNMTTPEMPERETAAYFQEHRDDEEEWEEEPEEGVAVRPQSVVYSVRFNPNELMELRRVAANRGVTLSELIRTAVVEHVRESRQSAVQVFARLLVFLSRSEPQSAGTRVAAVPAPKWIAPGQTG